MKRKKFVAVFLATALFLSISAFASADQLNAEVEDGDVVVEETSETDEAEVTEETAVETDEVTVEESESVTEETTIDELSDETTETSESLDVGSYAEVEPASTDVMVEETVAEVVEENLYDFESAGYGDTIACTEYLACDYDVRTEADPNADVLVTLSQGTAVTVIGFSEDTPWIQVEIDGQIGYVNMTCLTFDANYIPEDMLTDEEAEELWSDFA